MALPVWSGWLLSGLFGLTLLACLTRWRQIGRSGDQEASCGHDDRWGAAAHAVMAGAMMVMLAPMPDPIPRPVWVTVFGLAALTFAVRAGLTGAPHDRHAAGRRSVRLHHLAASLGMLLMAAMPVHGSGHAHAVGAGFTGTLTVSLASGLGLYFLLRAFWLVREVAVAPAAPSGGTAVMHFSLRPRVVAGCELLMCAAMSYMLVAAAG